MFTVSSHRPDVRVFVKRLVIPRYIQTTNGASHLDANILRDAFSTYLPEEFRPDLIKAYAKKWVDASTAVDAVRQKLKRRQINDRFSFQGLLHLSKYFSRRFTRRVRP